MSELKELKARVTELERKIEKLERKHEVRKADYLDPTEVVKADDPHDHWATELIEKFTRENPGAYTATQIAEAVFNDGTLRSAMIVGRCMRKLGYRQRKVGPNRTYLIPGFKDKSEEDDLGL